MVLCGRISKHDFFFPLLLIAGAYQLELDSSCFPSQRENYFPNKGFERQF